MRISGKVALLLAVTVPLLTGCKSIFSAHGFSHIKVKVADDQLLAQYGQKQIAIGREALENGEYGLALIAFRNVERDPAYAAAAHNGMAIAYDGIGRPDLAERFFKQAIADSPEDKNYQANLQHFYANAIAAPFRTEQPELLATTITDPLMAPDLSRPSVVNIVSADPSGATFRIENQALVLRRVSDHEVQISRPNVVLTAQARRKSRSWNVAAATSVGRSNPTYPVRLAISPNY
jgi:tetratricopeptide (TPR) repeat protein